MINNYKKHLATVSLIEIMMIFLIIGVVTAAGISLTKPKDEYIRKIQVYSAYTTLQAAITNIITEGHLDYTTDIGTCKSGRKVISTSYYICNSVYNSAKTLYPENNNLLPKVSSRAASKNGVNDVGISYTAYSNTTTVLSPERKTQYKYMQDGLCQRLSYEFGLSAENTNCPTNSASSSAPGSKNLIPDNLPSSFTSYQPQLTLPNGQAYYISLNSFSKYNPTYNTYNSSRYKTGTAVGQTDYTTTRTAEDTLFTGTRESIWPKINTNIISRFSDETRNSLFDTYATLAGESTPQKVLYLQKQYSSAKNYFIIYIDVNGKMTNTKDYQKGPDLLNTDIFAFYVYRNGLVLPAYDMGFPKKMLTAKVVYRKLVDSKYEYYPITSNGQYSNLPLLHAMCIANSIGDIYYTNLYPEVTGNDRVKFGICETTGFAPYSNSSANINCNGTVDGTLVQNCKAILNKPSFFYKH